MKALLALVLIGCGAAVPPLPSKGGPQWIEIESEHFTLWTDADSARGTELVEQMEYLHQIVFGIALAGHPTQGRAFAIALRDRDEVHAYLDEMFGAVSFVGDNALNQPAILLPADLSASSTTVTHELTHIISDIAVKHQPVWYAEGLAQFFETTKLDTSNQTVTVGEPTPQLVARALSFRLLTGPQLFGCVEMRCRDGQFYTTSALVFAYLFNNRQKQLAVFQDLVSSQAPHPWETAFPDLPAEALARTVLTWQNQGAHTVLHFNARLAHPSMHQRPLTDADVLAARAFLILSLHGDGAETRHAIELARTADPSNLMAVLVENQRAKSVPIALARQMTQVHPEDWRSWMLVLAAKATGNERKIAQAKLCTLVQSNPANYVGDWCPAAMLHPIAVPNDDSAN